MNKTIKFVLIILTIIFVVLTLLFVANKWRQSKCGDNICQKWEQKNETCANDCKNSPNGSTSDYKVKSITKLTEKGGRVDWGLNNIIAFDRKGSDGYYDIWTINLDGTNEKCLTCEAAGIPQMHNGNPTWHASGSYIVFQAQDPNLKTPWYENWATHPGGGINSNLWIANKEGNKFWKLTSIEERLGVLHPKFSKDGKKIIWAQRTQATASYKDALQDFWGEWEIKMADFYIENNEPKIKNITSIKFEKYNLYETHGFSPDNKKITFSASSRGNKEASTNFDEFVYDLKTSQLINLTNSPKEWDEFAQFSPDGQKIIWATSDGIARGRDSEGKTIPNERGLDYWIMDSDGSNKQKLTHFNDPGYTEYNKNGVATAEYSWGPDNTKIIAKTRELPGKFDENEKIIIIEFEK